MFPCPVVGLNGCTTIGKGAGDYTYAVTKSTLGSNYTLREPRKTFRFSILYLSLLFAALLVDHYDHFFRS